MDTDHVLPLLAGTVLTLFGLSVATSLGEHLDGMLRIVSVFTIVGAWTAYRASRRRSTLDPFTIITRWQGAGLAVGVLLEFVSGVA